MRKNNSYQPPSSFQYRNRPRNVSIGLSRVLTTALIVVDMEPILKTERLRCEKISEQLNNANAELEHFKNISEPAYSRWFRANFGEKLTTLRELEDKTQELEQLIEDVQIEAMSSHCSAHTAYTRLEKAKLRRLKAAEDREKERLKKQEEGKQENLFAEDSKEDDLSPEMEEFLRFSFEQQLGRQRVSKAKYDQMFESFKQNFREEVLGDRNSSQRERETSTPKPSYNETPEDLQIKQLYRILARKLHPDINANLTRKELELWFEVQTAYETKNLEQLETIDAMLEGGGVVGYSKIQSVSRLRSIFKEIHLKLKATERALREEKKNPAWKFDEVEKNQTKLGSLAQQIELELNEVIEDLAITLGVFEDKIDTWKNPDPIEKRQSSRGRGRGYRRNSFRRR